MIKVTILKNSEGQMNGFEVKGHSGYAASGSDIICAGVSALAQNCVNSIESFTSDRPSEVTVEEGTGLLRFRLETVSKESKLLLDSFVLGIRDISETYNKFVQIR